MTIERLLQTEGMGGKTAGGSVITGPDRVERRVTIAAWGLIAGAGVALATALLPDASLLRLVQTVDPDRTVRPLFDANPTMLRAALLLCASGLGLLGVAVRRWSGPIAAWLGAGSPGRTDRPPGPEPWVWATLVGLVLLGIALRWVHVGLPLEGDESQTYIFFASRSLLDVVSDYTAPNNHVFHTVFVWFSTKLFGPHPIAIRAPAFLAGVAAIPIAFALGRRERGALLGLALAALIAVGPPFVEFSGRARGYTLQLVLLLWILMTVRRAVAGGGGKAWLELSLASALGMWTSPSFVLPLGGVALWALWLRHDPPFVGRLAGALGTGAGLTLVLYGPIIVRSGLRSLASPGAWEPQSLDGILRMGGREAEFLAECWTGGLGPLGWPALALLGAGVLWGLRRGDAWARLIVCCVVWYVAFTLTRGLKPRARMMNWALPLLFLGAAGWAAWMQADSVRVRRWGALAILSLAAAWGSAQVLAHADHRTRFVRGHDEENFCTGGYFADSESVARAFAEVYEDGDLLVTPPFAGILNPIRVELMREGLSPTVAYSFSRAWGPARIGGYPTWYVVAQRRHWDGSVTGPAFDALAGGDPLDRVAEMLQTEPTALRGVAGAAEVWREFENAVVLRVEVRPEVAAATERLADRDIIPYGW